VYLALMGPQGMVEIGEGLMQRTAYAIHKLKRVPGVKIPFKGVHFKDFVVDFNQTGQTVKAIHKKLFDRGIFGGKDLSTEFPALGQCALYAVTEIHNQADIDRLATTLQEVLE
jgi:glycine dehydrogenase subunit 1